MKENKNDDKHKDQQVSYDAMEQNSVEINLLASFPRKQREGRTGRHRVGGSWLTGPAFRSQSSLKSWG